MNHDNPLLADDTLPAFSRIRPEHIAPAVDAILADETLYLKADAESAARFQAAGGEAFSFTYKDGRHETMNYWTVPEEAMESPGEMMAWGRLALDAAIRSRRPATKGGRNKRAE